MTPLAQTQDAFLACLLDDDAALPGGWSAAGDARRAAGMAVYRNAYRARLMDVLRETYERTARLVGEDAFRQAAAHHLITHPPGSWTIDLAGDGFAGTCAELFARDPDVGEIAWLEWAMHRAFTAADGTPWTAAEWAAATVDFDAGQWDAMRIELMPGTAMRPVTFDVLRLWEMLADGGIEPAPVKLKDPAWLLVWREGERSVFGLIPPAEGQALSALQNGATFGELCADLSARHEPTEAAAAAAMVLRWLTLGLLHRILPAR